MARDGITKLQVQQVRIALIAQGRHPSVEAVRAELGTGSNTTILKYLKELGEDEKGRLDDLDALSDELGQLVGHLARRLQDEALQRVQHAEERHTLALLEKLQQIDTQGRELNSSYEQCETLQEQLRDALAQINGLKEARHQDALKIAAMTTEMRHLTLKLHDRDTQIQSLEEKHTHARQALEHYRESVKTNREQDLQRHEHQVQQLQAELRTSQQIISVKQKDYTEVKEQAQELTLQLKYSQDAAAAFEKQLTSLKDDNNDLRHQQQINEAVLSELKHAVGANIAYTEELTTQLNTLRADEQAWLQEKSALTATLATQQQLWQQLVPKLEASTPPIFAVGEDVLVTDPESRLYNKIGQITRYTKRSDGSMKYSVSFEGEICSLSDLDITLA